MTHLKLKTFALLIILFIILLLYQAISYNKESKNIPSEIITKTDPLEFPNKILVEKNSILSTIASTTLSGKNRLLVSYLSDKNKQELIDLYVESLKKNNWLNILTINYQKVSIIKAENGVEKMIITIEPVELSKTKVTFQYDK